MSTTTTTTSTKVDLTAKANAYYAKQNEIRKARAVEFVEKTAIEFLIGLANEGKRNTVLCYPSDLYMADVIEALTTRVKCDVRRTGTGAKLFVSW